MTANHLDDEYDVILIGAGIGGLVCGNYLAKAGLKTLILEQHYLPGGCASAFQRNGFTFDSGAHSLGSCREGGQFDKILKELGLREQISIKRATPSDSVITDRFAIGFGTTLEREIAELSRAFPKQASHIKSFLTEIDGFDINSPGVIGKYLLKYKLRTFGDMLNSYFTNSDLKNILCAFLGNAGLSSRQIGAIPALSMYKEFVLDGGYFVDGGMGAFVDYLATSFKGFGGTLSFSNRVQRLIVSDGRVKGVSTTNDDFIGTRKVVSSAGLKQTFLKLIGRDHIPSEVASKVEKLRASVSAFVVYLGVRGTDIWKSEWGRTIWYSPENCSDQVYAEAFEGQVDERVRSLLVAFPSRFDDSLVPAQHSSLHLFMVAPFMSTEYWASAKSHLMDKVVARAEGIIPGLRQRIAFAEAATPATMHRYTLNEEGAMYGLASLPSQYQGSVMPQHTCIEGLLLASHWSTVGAGQGGTPMAAFAGRSAARMILECHKTSTSESNRN